MPTTTAPETMIDRIENASPLDPVVKTVRKIVNVALGPQPVRDALHGLWLGPPLHPMLTDRPIGAGTGGGGRDLVPGPGRARPPPGPRARIDAPDPRGRRRGGAARGQGRGGRVAAPPAAAAGRP